VGLTANGSEPLLQARNVVQEFAVRGHGGVKGGVVQAVSDVSLDVRAGETLGIVGETGSGKSTLARSLLQAPRPKSGSVTLRGTELVGLRGKALLQARRSTHMASARPRHAARACARCSTASAWTPTSSRAGARASCRAARRSAWRSPAR